MAARATAGGSSPPRRKRRRAHRLIIRGPIRTAAHIAYINTPRIQRKPSAYAGGFCFFAALSVFACQRIYCSGASPGPRHAGARAVRKGKWSRPGGRVTPRIFCVCLFAVLTRISVFYHSVLSAWSKSLPRTRRPRIAAARTPNSRSFVLDPPD